MYELTTEIYKNKQKNLKTITPFDKYGDAIIAAKHVADVLKNVMTLTRHSSCEEPINHCGYYADHYNELFICVKKVN